jgi:hypothetical protein
MAHELFVGRGNCAERILPSDGNDALAHDARRIRFGRLGRATTARRLGGNLKVCAHECLFFIELQDDCALRFTLQIG